MCLGLKRVILYLCLGAEVANTVSVGGVINGGTEHDQGRKEKKDAEESVSQRDRRRGPDCSARWRGVG